MQPYTDQEKEGKKIRTFSADVENEELVWHRDKAHREVTVIEGTGWFFQLDERVPFELKEGTRLFIPKMEWHRLFKAGESNLVLEIVEKQTPSFKDVIESKMPKKYGSGLGDSTKDKRRAQFNKQAKMDDDDPDAYKPAPGDARAKTKPSKYTKAYKDMFGEKVEYYSMPELKKQLKKEYGSEASSLKIVKVKGPGRTQSVSIQTPSGQELDRYNNVPGLGYTLAEDTEDTKGIGTDGLAKNYKKITPGQSVEEKLDPKKDDAGDYIKDFMKSDAPQFKGKSKEKIRQMAIAAYLDDKDSLTEKTIKGLEKKADETGVAYDILKKVYDRGMAAWRTGHRPGATPHQWAFARVNSFVTGGKTQKTADADLWAKHKGKKESAELEEKLIKPSPAIKQKLIKVAGLTAKTAEKIMGLPQPMLTTVINQLLLAGDQLEESLSSKELSLISKVEKMLITLPGIATDLKRGHATVKKFNMAITNKDVAVFKKASEQIKSFILSRSEVSMIKKLAKPAGNREKKALAVFEKMIKELPSMYDRVYDSWDDLDRYGANVSEEELAKLAKTVDDFSSFVLTRGDIELVKKTLNDAAKLQEAVKPQCLKHEII